MQRYDFFHKDEKSSRVFLSLTDIFRSAQERTARTLHTESKTSLASYIRVHLSTNLQKFKRILERKKITDKSVTKKVFHKPAIAEAKDRLVGNTKTEDWADFLAPRIDIAPTPHSAIFSNAGAVAPPTPEARKPHLRPPQRENQQVYKVFSTLCPLKSTEVD